MTNPDVADRLVSDWLQDGAYVAPDEPVEAAISHARAHPRRPDPFAFLRKDAMTSSRTILGFSPAAAAVLAVVLVAGVLAAGSYLSSVQPPAPTPQPSASGLAQASVGPTPAAPSPTAAPATAAASSAPFIRQDEPGTAIPDTLLGTWYDAASPAFAWIYRAGNPYCIEVVSTDQDCMAWQLPDGRATYGGVLTILSDGTTLAIRYLNGSGCRNAQGTYAVTLAGQSLTLVDTGKGTCGSGDYHWVRAGQGSAPTAPPEPQP